MGKRGKGEGTIYKRADGTWAGQISCGIDGGTGNPIRKTFYGKQRKDVVEKMKDFNDNKLMLCKNGITLEKWLDTWLKTYNTDISYSTYDDYSGKIDLHIKPALGKLKLAEIKPIIIQQFYNEKLNSGRADGKDGGLSERSVRYIHVVLRAALEQAKREGFILINPADAIKLPKKSQVLNDRFVFTPKEQKQFLKACEGDRLYALFAFALLTGCRQGEIIALKWRYLDFKNREVTVCRSASNVKNRFDDDKKTMTIIKEPKTESSIRKIPLCGKLVEIMEQHKKMQDIDKERYADVYEDEDFVFTTELGHMLDYRNLIRKFKKLLKAADIPYINFHSLRHSFATRLLEKGTSMKVIQEYMGHKSFNLTANTYSHVVPEIKKNEIERLNDLF